MDETKYFTLDEAQALLPVLDSLLKRAIEARRSAQALEEELQALTRNIFLNGGTYLNIERVGRRRASYESHLRQAKDTLAEIDAIGVQVKDLDTGLLDFPCLIEGETVFLCWKMGESKIEYWHTLDAGFRGRQPIDERFTPKKPSGKKPDRPK